MQDLESPLPADITDTFTGFENRRSLRILIWQHAFPQRHRKTRIEVKDHQEKERRDLTSIGRQNCQSFEEGRKPYRVMDPLSTNGGACARPGHEVKASNHASRRLFERRNRTPFENDDVNTIRAVDARMYDLISSCQVTDVVTSDVDASSPRKGLDVFRRLSIS